MKYLTGNSWRLIKRKLFSLSVNPEATRWETDRTLYSSSLVLFFILVTITRLTIVPSIVSVSKRYPSSIKLTFPLGMLSISSCTKPLRVLGPSVDKSHHVALLISRIVAVPSIRYLLSLRYITSSSLSAVFVVKSPTISSSISSKVTRP